MWFLLFKLFLVALSSRGLCCMYIERWLRPSPKSSIPLFWVIFLVAYCIVLYYNPRALVFHYSQYLFQSNCFHFVQFYLLWQKYFKKSAGSVSIFSKEPFFLSPSTPLSPIFQWNYFLFIFLFSSTSTLNKHSRLFSLLVRHPFFINLYLYLLHWHHLPF